jgi:5-hydroxyisourate hydrolase-like protein (transthyretin family)
MPRAVLSLAVPVLVAGLTGCGAPAMVAVKVKVTHDGKPVDNCKVGFVQDVESFDPKSHGYGYGNTDKDGVCEIAHPMTGEKGLYPGTYKVTFEAWKNRRGQSVPPTEKPSEVEGEVFDRLPQALKSIGSTTERLTVVKGTPVDHEFKLTGK